MKRLAAFWTSLWARIRAYAAHEDPLAEAANWIALVVAWNQPFYPLYVYAVVGDRLAPVFLTFLSTPFFAAIPALSRRRPTLSRALLPAVGMANAAVSANAFGIGSGVEIFLIPCALIAAALFRPAERLIGLSLAAVAPALYFGLHGHYGAPLGSYTPDELASLATLNVLSAATLCVFVGMLLSGVIAKRERSLERREALPPENPPSRKAR